MIPEDTIREIRERATILDVVSDYVSLKKAGTNYQGLCPFHGEKTPSFNVNPGRGIFHCFGCGVGGNAFKFIEMIEGLSFPEAVKFLAKRVGIHIEDRPLSQRELQRRDEREEYYRITELASQFYRSLLLSGDEGEPCRQYLAERGVDLATAEAYRLGFAPGRWDALCRYLERRKVPLDQVEKLGLVRHREGGGYYDIFRNRLLFTIADFHGRPIAFGGRVLDDALPKYINSPESPIYHKGDILFGLDLAKQAIREKGAAIIVEGYFDHLSLYQAGVKEVVATCGTALTPDHVKLLRRYAGRFYTLFDSDGAGQKATIKAMELLLPEAVPTSVIELPEGDDPDSFVKREGADAFAQLLSKARPVIEYYLRQLLAKGDAGTIEGKRRILAAILPNLRLITDRIQRRLYVSEVARVLGIDEAELRRETGLQGLERREAATSHMELKRTGSGSAEMLLMLIATYPDLAARAAERELIKLLPGQLVPLAEAIIAESRGHGSVDLSTLLERTAVAGGNTSMAALFVDDTHLEGIDPHKAFDQCCAALERRPLKDLKELARELARIEPDSPRYCELLEEIDSLRNMKSQLS